MELREAVDKTNKELIKTNNELQTTKAELNNTKTELQSTKLYLQNEIIKATPSGTIAYFSSTVAPNGWLKANGHLVSRTAYANLFSAIGTTFGSGDGNTTFKIPDLRGEFIRSWNDGSDIDVNRVFGSSQVGSIIPLAGYINGTLAAGSFAHQNRYGFAAYTFDDGVDNNAPSGETKRGITFPNNAGDNEMYYIQTPNKGFITHWNTLRGTRPRNIALLSCIKY